MHPYLAHECVWEIEIRVDCTIFIINTSISTLPHTQSIHTLSLDLTCMCALSFPFTGFCVDGEFQNEFVFAIPRILHSESPRVMASTTTQQSVHITVSIPGIFFHENYTINKTHGADIPLNLTSRMERRAGKQNKTIIVTAPDNVHVYAIDNEWVDGDVFQAIPSSRLGSKYYVASYKPYDTSQPSFICVSAIHTNTAVSISTPSGLIHNFILEQYESYRYDGGDYEDLSGTLVQSEKPIVVVSGSGTQIPAAVKWDGGILEMLVPFQNYGKTFYVFPFLSLSSGFVYRVFASDISTTVYMSNGNVVVEPGKYHEVDVTGDNGVFIQADQPIMAVQYMKGHRTNNPWRGDPSMLVVPPISSYTNNVTFPVFQYTYTTTPHDYYINVVTKCQNVVGLLYDNVISMTNWDTLSTYSMCCVRGKVSTGFHSVSHANPAATFSVSVYAIIGGSTYLYATSGIPAQHLGKYS